MIGNSEQKGMVQICLEEIFKRKLELESESEVSVQMQYVEIYNEKIMDLLSSEKKQCFLRDDSSKGVKIQEAQKVQVHKVEAVQKLLLQGNQRRCTECTNANEASSRSHAVL